MVQPSPGATTYSEHLTRRGDEVFWKAGRKAMRHILFWEPFGAELWGDNHALTTCAISQLETSAYGVLGKQNCQPAVRGEAPPPPPPPPPPRIHRAQLHDQG
ncbi:hypothetical protein K470DRAFT_80200 [Piedraia hortae CBS 480.64]|uniref:Uncharacterized protein n=1 Tax=Piedraia hortae CBS 480.64 TaxID=1314780 RepID=A0A6A7BYE2_9PEZI|nr:hypothetical protein K470DRAFT_80200 [Piedraia hortae CBS 480.64]